MKDEVIVEEIPLSDEDLIEHEDGSYEVSQEMIQFIIDKCNEYNNRTLH